MDFREFKNYQNEFISALKKVLNERGKDSKVSEAGFPAYTDAKFLARFLFWRRIWLVNKFLQENKPYENVIDFGCGSGVLLPILNQCANKVVGIDVDLIPYKAVSKHFTFPPNVEIIQNENNRLEKFEEKSVDLIVCLDVLEHVTDLDSILKQFVRILKKDGKILISGPTENIFYKIGRKIAGKDYKGDYHVSNIYHIKNSFTRVFKVNTIATLYYPIPLFKIYTAGF